MLKNLPAITFEKVEQLQKHGDSQCAICRLRLQNHQDQHGRFVQVSRRRKTRETIKNHNKNHVVKRDRATCRLLKKSSASAYAIKHMIMSIDNEVRTSAKTLMKEDFAEKKEFMIDVVRIRKTLGFPSDGSVIAAKKGEGIDVTAVDFLDGASASEAVGIQTNTDEGTLLVATTQEMPAVNSLYNTSTSEAAGIQPETDESLVLLATTQGVFAMNRENR